MKRLRHIAGTGILSFLLINVGWTGNLHAQNGWERMTDMPTSRSVLKSVEHNGKIFVIGGDDSKTTYAECNEVHDIESDTWSVKASMNSPRVGHTLEVLNNKIYVVGGVQSLQQNYSNILEYDIETDVWITKCEMPEPRFNHFSEVLDGKIYISGGMTVKDGSHPGLLSSLVYDPVNDHWDTIADLNHERHLGGSCIYDNKIYVFGGAPSGIPIPMAHRSIEIYDPEADVWTLSDDEVPVPFMYGIVIAHGDNILLFGGYEKVLTAKCYSSIFLYAPNFSEYKWKVMTSMPVDRARMSGNKVNNYLHMFGGIVGIENAGSMANFSPIFAADNHWRFNLDSLKEQEVPCSEVLISQNSLTLEKGHSHLLSASVLPSYATDRSVLWASSSEDIATVSSDGNVTAESDGKVTITASTNDGMCTASCEVTVVIPVTGVSLSQYTLDLEKDQTSTLVATVSPPDATDPLLNWWSDDDEIATVNENGDVTANSVDSTYIHVSTNDGGYTDSCQVFVSPAAAIMPPQFNNTISIYPNPVSDLLSIQTGSVGTPRVCISSIAGQAFQSFTMEQTSKQIDLSSYREGVYLLTIRSKEFVTTYKILKL